MKGLITKTTGVEYSVLSDDSNFNCRIKGTFRIKGIKSTNPLAVGDIVEFDPESGYITELYDRKNYIVRKPANLSKQQHIIAANLDLCLLTVTVSNPVTSIEFIDRFLVTAEAYRVPVILLFNKVDILTPEETEYLDAIIHLYDTIGYKSLKISALNGDGIEELQNEIKGKITLLSGNSGVGKSTVINAIDPTFRARTAQISTSHHKGMHTTTFSEMYRIGNDTFIIDTPGIKGFGMFDMQPEEVSHFFPEIFRISHNCRFNNCTHIHEPGCAVLEAIDKHFISQSRYRSYLSIRQDISEGKYRL